MAWSQLREAQAPRRYGTDVLLITFPRLSRTSFRHAFASDSPSALTFAQVGDSGWVAHLVGIRPLHRLHLLPPRERMSSLAGLRRILFVLLLYHCAYYSCLHLWGPIHRGARTARKEFGRQRDEGNSRRQLNEGEPRPNRANRERPTPPTFVSSLRSSSLLTHTHAYFFPVVSAVFGVLAGHRHEDRPHGEAE